MCIKKYFYQGWDPHFLFLKNVCASVFFYMYQYSGFLSLLFKTGEKSKVFGQVQDKGEYLSGEY